MPPGFYFQDKIEVNLVSGDVAQPIAFSTDYFAFHPDYFPYPDGRAPAGLAADMGFSGIRFRTQINRPGVFDEVAVFQGASYFRAVAHDSSTDSPPAVSPSAPPARAARSSRSSPPSGSTSRSPATAFMRLSALLDSDSVAGAFGFAMEPGHETVMHIRSVLFPRRPIARRHRAADQDVLLRPGAPRRRRRLPRRGARQRRPAHGQRLRRAAVAAAAQSHRASRPRPSPTTNPRHSA